MDTRRSKSAKELCILSSSPSSINPRPQGQPHVTSVRAASQLGELSAHLLAAIALVLPGVGPIVADGPLAAGLGEAAGHVAGGIARALHQAGVDRDEADRWQQRIEAGAMLIGAHVDPGTVGAARDVFARHGAASVVEATWND
jgi:hypothetical protein